LIRRKLQEVLCRQEDGPPGTDKGAPTGHRRKQVPPVTRTYEVCGNYAASRGRFAGAGGPAEVPLCKTGSMRAHGIHARLR
jgi:hypothetical protein